MEVCNADAKLKLRVSIRLRSDSHYSLSTYLKQASRHNAKHLLLFAPNSLIFMGLFVQGFFLKLASLDRKSITL